MRCGENAFQSVKEIEIFMFIDLTNSKLFTNENDVH